MNDFDPRDLRPRARGDRRQGPRRLEETRLHYTREALVAEVCEFVSHFTEDDLEFPRCENLYVAVYEYRRAVEGLGKDRGDDQRIDEGHALSQARDDLGWPLAPIDIDTGGRL